MIRRLYRELLRELLGRAADANGPDYWNKTGYDEAGIRSGIMAADEYKRRHPASLAPVVPDSSNPVVLFVDVNFAGALQKFPVGKCGDFRTLAIGNDAVSSVRVASGWSVILLRRCEFWRRLPARDERGGRPPYFGCRQ